MLLVYELKNTLSIGEIKCILQNVYALPTYSGAKLEETYLRFVGIKEQERANMPALLDRFVDAYSIHPENEDEFFALLLGLSTLSSYLKNTVQALLEAHYPDPDAEKVREEQERREEAKRQKEEKKAAAKIAKLEAAMQEIGKNDAGKATAGEENEA